MSEDRIKRLLFDVCAAIDKAKSSDEYEALMAQYRALKNQWNKLTGNAVLGYALSEEI